MEVVGAVQIKLVCYFCCFAQMLMEKLHFEFFVCNFCSSDGLG